VQRAAGSTTPVGLFASAADIDRARVPASGFRDAQFQVQECDPLQPGEVLLLCTDGLAEHLEGRFVGSNLGPLLAGAHQRPVADVCDLVREAILMAGPPQDDISLILVRKR
jgi:serine phosphatase RsbU (regulator of sigma subunit)